MKKETMTVIVSDLNEDQKLYCTECCNTFVPTDVEGRWEDRAGRTRPNGEVKYAEQINDHVIQCSCGQAIGYVADELILPGEVVAIN